MWRCTRQIYFPPHKFTKNSLTTLNKIKFYPSLLLNFVILTVFLWVGMCGKTSPRFICVWVAFPTPCTSLRAVHGVTHSRHVSDVPLAYMPPTHRCRHSSMSANQTQFTDRQPESGGTRLRSPGGTDSCLTVDEEWRSHDESTGGRESTTKNPGGMDSW